VGLVAFEIARRYRFNEDLERVPEGVDVHVLPSGSERSPSMTMSYRGARQVAARIDAAAVATRGYLDGLGIEAAG
jgi:NTE family protein